MLISGLLGQRRSYFCLFCLIFCSFHINAQEKDRVVISSEQAEDKPELTPSLLDRQQDYVTERLFNATEKLDRWLSRKKHTPEGVNQSYLIANMGAVFNEGGEHDYYFRLRGKADLPNTKQRLRLIFESQPDEDVMLEESERRGHVGDNNIPSDESIAGLEFIKKRERWDWQPSINFGARLDFPLDLFSRARLKKQTRLPAGWILQNHFQLAYFARKGARTSASFELERSITPSLFFSTTHRYQYTRRERLQEFMQSVQLRHLWNTRSAVEYRVGAFANDQTSEYIDHYFAQFSLKHGIYDDWMYLSWIPEVRYFNDNDWTPTYSFTLQLQAIFSK